MTCYGRRGKMRIAGLLKEIYDAGDEEAKAALAARGEQRVTGAARLRAWFMARMWRIPLAFMLVHISLYGILTRVNLPRHLVECSLDRAIPYIPAFIVPYYLWFALVPATLLTYLLLDRKSFLRLCIIMLGGIVICDIIFLIYPSEVRLWPEDVGDSIFAPLVALIYAVDRPVNVFPSIHVSTTVAIFLVNMRSKLFRGKHVLKLLSLLVTVAIWLSTMFVKQHSVIDGVAGAALSIVLFLMTEPMMKVAEGHNQV